MFCYAIIGADDEVRVCHSEERPDYDTISKCVGGWIEGVPIEGVTAYINEEGKNLRLPNNKIANILAHEDGVLHPHDYLCGDMIVFGPLDEDGDVTSLPAHFIPSLMTRLGLANPAHKEG